MTVHEAAWDLLNTLEEVENAQGLDDKQYARWNVTKAASHLRAALIVEGES